MCKLCAWNIPRGCVRLLPACRPRAGCLGNFAGAEGSRNVVSRVLRIFAPRIPKFLPPEYWMGFLQAHQSRSAQSMTRDSAISHPDLTTAGSVLSVGTSLQLRTRSRSVKPRIETTVAQKLILSGDATVRSPLAFFLGVIRKPKLNTLRKAPRPMNSSSNSMSFCLLISFKA